MKHHLRILAICILCASSSCHRDDAIPNDVEMTVRGEVIAAKSYTLQIDEDVSRVKSDDVMLFNIASRRLSIRVIETEYTLAYSRLKAKSEMDDNLLPDADVIHENKKGMDYYGYYIPIVEKDWQGHGFRGYVFGKSSVLRMEFAFVDIDDLAAVKEIWLSTKER
jgi:hypothetical protein